LKIVENKARRAKEEAVQKRGKRRSFSIALQYHPVGHDILVRYQDCLRTEDGRTGSTPVPGLIWLVQLVRTPFIIAGSTPV
jgi:hypothetical protein